MKRSPQDSAATEYIDALHLPERRAHLRHQPRSIVYVELDEGNGGIALNLSEDGLAVQSVMPLVDDFLARLRFQLSDSKEWVETSAQVVWANESRKLLGLRFIELPEASRRQIREWLQRECLPPGIDGQQILSEGLEGRAAPPAMAMAAVPTESTPTLTFSEELAETVSTPESVSHPEEVPVIFPAEKQTADTGTRTYTDAVSGVEPSDRAEPAFSFQSESFRSAANGRNLPNSWSIAVFFLFLATSSLAAGWAVGRGAFAGGIQTLRKVTFRDSATGGALAPVAGDVVPHAHLSEIEIINTASERWTIPLTASSLGTGGQTRRESGGSSTSPSGAKAVPFKTWVLSAPLQSKSAGADSEIAAPTEGASIEPAQSALSVVSQPYSLAAPQPPKQSVIKHAELIRSVNPVYPVVAIDRHIEGTVKMHVLVTASGRVRDVKVISGPLPLTAAAVQAASQWIYSPTLVDGKPIDSEMDVSIAFHLP